MTPKLQLPTQGLYLKVSKNTQLQSKHIQRLSQALSSEVFPPITYHISVYQYNPNTWASPLTYLSPLLQSWIQSIVK